MASSVISAFFNFLRLFKLYFVSMIKLLSKQREKVCNILGVGFYIILN